MSCCRSTPDHAQFSAVPQGETDADSVPQDGWRAAGAVVTVLSLTTALLSALSSCLLWAASTNSWCKQSSFVFRATGLRGVPLGLVSFLASCILAALCASELWRHRAVNRVSARAHSVLVALGLLSPVVALCILSTDDTHRTALRFVVHFAPALHLLALAVATCTAYPTARALLSRLRREPVRGHKNTGRRLLAECAAGIWLLSLPLLLLTPVVIESSSTGILRGQIPLKPRLIAHRGVSRIAPENSLEGIEAASGTGVYGVEFDVAVTRDGVPVLLHDRTFRRTTDIDRVFPGRARDDPSHFTSQELSRLTLSRWCNRQCDGPMDKEIERTFNEARVPTMAQALESAQRQRLHAIWDLRKPSNEHAGDWMDIILNVTMASTTVDRSLVWWLSDGMSERARSAGFKRACPVKPGHWERAEGRQCDVLNMHHAVSVEELQRAKKSGAWVNVYVVDTEWLFSQLWVLGVDSVTTTNPFVMARMHKPAYTLDLWTYRSLWALADLVTLLVVTGRLLVVLGGPSSRRADTELFFMCDDSMESRQNR